MKTEYRHIMEQTSLDNEKKEEILTMLERHDNTQRRRMTGAAKIVLAAALAAGCVLSIAAGLPAQVYNFVAGGSAVINPGTGEGSFTYGDENDPITVENGRLWFDADGRKVDVTDKMDAGTPYVYERTDPKTGNKGYVILGGTVDDYGWAEIFMTEDGTCSILGCNAWEYTVPIGGRDIPLSELTEAQRDLLNADGGIPTEYHNQPWLDAALAQLGLDVQVLG